MCSRGRCSRAAGVRRSAVALESPFYQLSGQGEACGPVSMMCVAHVPAASSAFPSAPPPASHPRPAHARAPQPRPAAPRCGRCASRWPHACMRVRQGRCPAHGPVRRAARSARDSAASGAARRTPHRSSAQLKSRPAEAVVAAVATPAALLLGIVSMPVCLLERHERTHAHADVSMAPTGKLREDHARPRIYASATRCAPDGLLRSGWGALWTRALRTFKISNAGRAICSVYYGEYPL